jgi:Kdo2-lipid IVA lauroyltransferase/acyltransferase
MGFSIGDYLIYCAAKGLSLFFRCMPFKLALFIGRRLGVFFMLFNRKRYRIAYANLKAALGEVYCPKRIKGILKNTYANIGQGIVEVFLLPKINRSYIERYIEFEDFDIVHKVLSKGSGLIFLTAHFGTWEISHAALPFKGLGYVGIARRQKPYLMNDLLNSYRQSHGCRIIMKGPGIKDALRTLRSNGVVGMLVDQDAGKSGVFTDLFKRPASWHRGVIEMAIKSGAEIVPGFAIRKKGPYVKFKVFPPLDLKRQAGIEEAVIDGMNQYARILENTIRQYPDQWLWQHRRWKSTPVRDVILLNDKRTGHLRQSEMVAEIIKQIWKERGYNPDYIRTKVIDVEFKKDVFKKILSLSSNLSHNRCQGCMNCLRFKLKHDSYDKLMKSYSDIVVSCGSSTAGVNLLLSRENNAKSIVIMKPALVGLRHFNLAIVPRHDKPAQKNNIVITEAALNLMNEKRLSFFTGKLKEKIGPVEKKAVGVLIGGDTRNFNMGIEKIKDVIEGALKICGDFDMEIFISTSRRTPKAIEDYLKERLFSENRCRLLIIANEHNPPGSVEAVLGLSDIVLISEESVSMISEAASSMGYRMVFRQGDYSDKKHNVFINNMEKSGYIETAGCEDIYDSLKKAIDQGIKQPILDDTVRVKKALERIL